MALTQKSISTLFNSRRNKAYAVATAAVISIAAGSLKDWEGRELKTYRDLAGIPTACDGITGADAVLGKTYTHAECDALLTKHLNRIDKQVAKCVAVPTSDNERAAILHFAYNIGPTAFCTSTMARRLNVGDYQGAADQILRWSFVRINGTLRDCNEARWKCAGIPRRRTAERDLFLTPDKTEISWPASFQDWSQPYSLRSQSVFLATNLG